METAPNLPTFLIVHLDELKSLLGTDLSTFARLYRDSLTNVARPPTETVVRTLDEVVVDWLWKHFQAKNQLPGLPSDFKRWLQPMQPSTLRAEPPREGPEVLQEAQVRNHFQAHEECCKAVLEQTKQLSTAPAADSKHPPAKQEPSNVGP